MLDNLSQNQRMLIAVVLSVIVLGIYDYFFIPKKPLANELNSTVTSKSVANNVTKSAPSVASSSETSAASSNSSAPVTQKETLKHKIIATVTSEHFTAKIDELGRIYKFTINDKRFENEKGERLELFKPSAEPKPLEIRFSDPALNEEAFKTAYSANRSEVKIGDGKQTIVLTQNLSDRVVKKEITFYSKGNYDIKVSVSKPAEFFITPGHRPTVIADAYTVHGVLVEEPDGTLTIIEDGKAKDPVFVKNAKILSAFDRYYATAFYDFDKGMDVVVSPENENPLPFVKANGNLNLKGFIGPKDHRVLESIDPRLTDMIEYGFFTFIAKPMFKLLLFLYEILGNWGWAIVVITILIRLILFPLTFKGMLSMSKMKELAPKMKELQQKYKDDRQKLNAHMMELYKKHGVNPMGGCLPMLLQIPVFFAIYRVLLNAIELKGAPWILWITDLSAKDPYFVLPILMGATMYWNQKITPMTVTDPTQEKIMKFLPIIFTFFFVTFPAGLTLYWFVNNLLSVAQQYFVNIYMEKQKKLKKAEA